MVDAPLEDQARNARAAPLLARHDVLGDGRPREGTTTIRTRRVLRAVREVYGTLAFRVEADEFCHEMVRSLVGALLLVGSGARDIDYPARVLRARSRASAAPIAPAHGLTLEGVDYPAPEEWAARAAQARARRVSCCGDDA